jgi:hypothetical protein
VRSLPLSILLLLSSATLFTNAAVASEPWVDPDPEEPPERYEIGAVGVSAEAEYRAQFTFVNPVLLNDETNRRFNLIQHRGRIGGTVDYDEVVAISMSLDLMDGVLWGDNGTFGGEPSSDSGLQATTRDPNNVKPCIQYLGEGDELEADSYGWGLCEAEAIKVRRLWGQVTTPVGVIRVGRMPVTVGMSVQTASGDGRRNRFGVADAGDQVDRVLFATKPLEALKPKEMRNRSEQEGMILAAMYDRFVTDTARVFEDDVHSVAGALRYLVPDFGLGSDFESMAYYAHRWDTKFGTDINTVGGRLAAKFDRLHVGVDMAGNVGSSSEVSNSYSFITNDPIVDQEILQFGGRAVIRYDWDMFTAYMEADYASGDGDPEPGTRLSQFRWSEDANVGLLLFDHIVHTQSARAAAAGVEITRRLGATTFAAERVNTRGAFTNAMVLFPQVDFRPHESLLWRLGALFAWAAEPVVDPVNSLQARDGLTIEDDLINFVGGKPGQFYGIEIDGRFQWRLYDHFAFDLEGAVFFPGDALEDENGDAINSVLIQGRTTFFF